MLCPLSFTDAVVVVTIGLTLAECGRGGVTPRVNDVIVTVDGAAQRYLGNRKPTVSCNQSEVSLFTLPRKPVFPT